MTPELHRSLLVGVTSAPLPTSNILPVAAESLEEHLLPLQPEDALWKMVAIHDRWERAGFQPHAVVLPPAAAADVRGCPPAAEDVLTLLLSGLYPNLLDTWLHQASIHRLRLPHAHLAVLLDLGLKNPAVRTAIIPLLDSRGTWLVAQNPEWSAKYSNVNESLSSQWRNGTPAERVRTLQVMRKVNPAAALKVLLQDWRAEPAENKAELLACLATNLGVHDEAFLEFALDDPRKDVRVQAQHLLAASPDSRFVHRCLAIVAPLISFKKNLSTWSHVEVTLPTSCDAAMLRDGVGIGADSLSGKDQKIKWLHDLLSRVPPRRWYPTWGIGPKEALDLMSKHAHGQAMGNAVLTAAIRNVKLAPSVEAFEWYRTFLDSVVLGTLQLDAKGRLMEVFGFLPVEMQEQLVTQWITTQGANWSSRVAMTDWMRQAASASSASWSERLSRLALARVQSQMQSASYTASAAGVLRGSLEQMPRVLDIGSTDYFETNWPPATWPNWKQWRTPVDEFLAAMRFRRTMHRSFMEAYYDPYSTS